MADGFFTTLVSKDENVNSVTNEIFTGLTDGTNQAAVTASGELNVLLGANSGVDIGDVDVTSVIPGVGATNLGKAEDAVHTSGDVGVMGLFVRQDAQADFGADGDYVPGSVDADGNLRVVASIVINSENAEDSPHTTGDVGSFMLGVRNTALADMTSTDQDYGAIGLTAKGAVFTEILQGGAANSLTNPIFVQTTNTAVSATEVEDKLESVLAGGATANHDYTVTGTTAFLEGVNCSASGAAKWEIQVGPIAGLVSKDVVFVSKQGGTFFWTPPHKIEIPVTGTGTSRVIQENREGASQSVYSTQYLQDV